jgi:hypothetical protein
MPRRGICYRDIHFLYRPALFHPIDHATDVVADTFIADILEQADRLLA